MRRDETRVKGKQQTHLRRHRISKLERILEPIIIMIIINKSSRVKPSTTRTVENPVQW